MDWLQRSCLHITEGLCGRLKYFGECYNNDTTVRPSETIPLEPCVREYQDKDKMWESLLRNVRPSWLKCGIEYWASVHNPWQVQEAIYDYSIVSPFNNYRAYLLNVKILFHRYRP